MSSEERRRTEEKEEGDVSAESRRTAAEERRARKIDEEMARKIRQKWEAKKPGHEEAENAKVDRQREARLGEIEVWMRTKKCPAARCGLRVQDDPRSKRTTCKLSSTVWQHRLTESFLSHLGSHCGFVFCWSCLRPWRRNHSTESCAPTENSQLDEAVTMSLEAERAKLQLQQETVDRTHAERRRKIKKAVKKREDRIGDLQRKLEAIRTEKCPGANCHWRYDKQCPKRLTCEYSQFQGRKK